MTVGLSSLVLFSFMPSNNTGNGDPVRIIRIKPYSYSVANTAGMAATDQAQMNKILTKVYGIKDFKEGQVTEFKQVSVSRWFAANKTWNPDKFTEKIVCGKDSIGTVTADMKELDALLSKYADIKPIGTIKPGPSTNQPGPSTNQTITDKSTVNKGILKKDK